MLLDIMQEKTMQPPTSLMQAIEFLRTNTSVADMLPEVKKTVENCSHYPDVIMHSRAVIFRTPSTEKLSAFDHAPRSVELHRHSKYS